MCVKKLKPVRDNVDSIFNELYHSRSPFESEIFAILLYTLVSFVTSLLVYTQLSYVVSC